MSRWLYDHIELHVIHHTVQTNHLQQASCYFIFCLRHHRYHIFVVDNSINFYVDCVVLFCSGAVLFVTQFLVGFVCIRFCSGWFFFLRKITLIYFSYQVSMSFERF